VYSTAPWGGVEQQDFLNAVLLVDDSTAGSYDWLLRSRKLEEDADRVRDQRWGPRSLDVDVVDCEGIISADPELTLPHPRAHLRAFVLIPWLDVEPGATLMVDQEVRAVAEVLANLDRSERDGVRVTDSVLIR
jgi:2-amino-4-hydroxy-6-hydroxymethyldihydropteridine diphosphokinase